MGGTQPCLRASRVGDDDDLYGALRQNRLREYRIADGSRFYLGAAVAVFHLSVDFEEADIVGRGLQAQGAAEFIVHLQSGPRSWCV